MLTEFGRRRYEAQDALANPPAQGRAMATATVGDFILERLSEWGVKRIFGFPGDGINGLMGAMGRAADRFDYIRVRHEEMSAFMAGAHAKSTGEVGVFMAPPGPGALPLSAVLYAGKIDHMPAEDGRETCMEHECRYM